MIKIFFYWLFNKSKTLRDLCRLNITARERELEDQHKKMTTSLMLDTREKLFNDYSKKERELLLRIRDVLEINQNRALRKKWRRITTNKNSPFYIFNN